MHEQFVFGGEIDSKDGALYSWDEENGINICGNQIVGFARQLCV